MRRMLFAEAGVAAQERAAQGGQRRSQRPLRQRQRQLAVVVASLGHPDQRPAAQLEALAEGYLAQLSPTTVPK
ncbi:hypothetical protein [Rhodobacter sp. CZR27]|uniref:hypothetical protein n=1 Tax=Rhodobacter sp. CZR27 TaxID=2033869 RepID=UPI0012FDB0D4|nr:hypothetical protein [Rhodobacter sp. CZR27]